MLHVCVQDIAMNKYSLWLCVMLIFGLTSNGRGLEPLASSRTFDVPGFASKDTATPWTWTCEDKTGNVTIEKNGSPDGKPCIHISYDGTKQWHYRAIVPNVKTGTDEGLMIHALGQATKGTVEVFVRGVNAKGRVGSPLNKCQKPGLLASHENPNWTSFLDPVYEADQFERVEVSFSGKGPTDIRLAGPQFLAGKPLSAGTCPKVEGWARAPRCLELDRGLEVVYSNAGMHLLWRILPEDTATTGFHIDRIDRTAAGDTSKPERITAKPVVKTSDFVDRTAIAGHTYEWQLRKVEHGNESNTIASVTRRVPATGKEAKPYRVFPLGGNRMCERVAVADLNGDRVLDFVVKYPVGKVDPWDKAWIPSPDTYKLEGWDSSGKRLWTIDLGWSIELGIWYSPVVVYDLNGDGRAEVIAKTGEGDPRSPSGRVLSGKEYLTVFDGETGKVIDRAPWPDGQGMMYSRYNRNLMTIAYLDGQTPFVVALRGSYNHHRLLAYQLNSGRLEKKLHWNNLFEKQEYWGQGAHNLHAADVDGDGREEICIGAMVLDDDGRPLWGLGLGHPDQMYVGELDPSRPGMEIYLGIETAAKANGMCMVDAKTGKILWGYDKPTTHIHGSGLCADIDDRYPGVECLSGEERHAKNGSRERFLWNAQGKLLVAGPEIEVKQKLKGLVSLSPISLYWDADPQKEVLMNRMVNYKTEKRLPPSIDGRFVATGDFFGDWREEFIVSVPGELRIYSTPIPAIDRQLSLLFDRNYHATITENFMGYAKYPLLGCKKTSNTNTITKEKKHEPR